MRLRDPERWPVGAKNMRRELGVLMRGIPVKTNGTCWSLLQRYTVDRLQPVDSVHMSNFKGRMFCLAGLPACARFSPQLVAQLKGFRWRHTAAKIMGMAAASILSFCVLCALHCRAQSHSTNSVGQNIPWRDETLACAHWHCLAARLALKAIRI